MNIGKGLASSHPDHLHEFVCYLRESSSSTKVTSSILNVWLSALAVSGKPERMRVFSEMVQGRLGVCVDIHGRELLLGAAAALGREDQVGELTARFVMDYHALTAGACVQMSWGYLSSQDIAAASRWLFECHQRTGEVPSRLILQLFKIAVNLGASTVDAALDGLMDSVPLTSDAVGVILQSCLATEDVEMARRVVRMADKFKISFTTTATEAILKLYARAGDPGAIAVFKDSIGTGFVASQGLCGSILSRCTASKFGDLAEVVGEYLQSQKSTTLATFKTLMKAYAYCGQFRRACDLYLHVLQSGTEPDDVMRGCVMKFAVLCGNISLCCDVLNDGGPCDPCSLSSLVRVAGREGDVAMVQALLETFEKHRRLPVLDVAVYNAAMEVCLASGHVKISKEVFMRAQELGRVDERSYAALVKGFCIQGDVVGAAKALEDMEIAGHSAQGACYNTLIGAAVAAGNMRCAWRVFHRMERQSDAIDPYALSIMLKAARHMRSFAEAAPILAYLDRETVDIFNDSILLNTALDACIQHRDAGRLKMMLESFSRSEGNASVQTYGLLIKASSCIGDTKRCKLLWREMTHERNVQPNAMTLGCMIDALVTAQLVDDAVELFQQWKEFVTVNTVIYATLMKGFVSIGDALGALNIFHQLKADGLQMNLVSYTTLIDSQARAGNMELASSLFEDMRKDGCEPSTITYSTLIKGHCIQGNLSEALKCFVDMVDRGLPADAVVFNTMLDGCVRHENFDLADKLLAEMPCMSVTPSSFTVSIVTKMWGKRRQLDKVFEAVRALALQHRLKLDARNGTTLISACFVNKAPQQAIHAFEEVRTWKHGKDFNGPDDGTYGALISGLVRCRWLRKAASYAEEACSGRPSVISCSAGSSTAGIASLKLLFRDLAQEGLVKELGRPVIDALSLAGERSLAFSLEQMSRGFCGTR